MPTLSPGIYVQEFDFAEYVARLGATTLAIVGGATKGPLNTPTILTSEGDLVRLFGAPVASDYGLQTAAQFLKRGSRVSYTRVADDDATAGAKTADVKLYGGVLATGSIAFSAKPVDGNSITLTPGNPICTLQNDANGTAGNVAIIVGGPGTQTEVVEGMSGGTVSAKATGAIRFNDSAQPVDGRTLTISDGVNTKVFEFDSNSAVGAGNVSVTIGGSAIATMANLVTAINGASSLNVTATNVTDGVTFEFDDDATVNAGAVPVALGSSSNSQFAVMQSLIAAINANAKFGSLSIKAADASAATPGCTLTAATVGDAYNATIVVGGGATSITVAGMAGGKDAGAQHLATITAASPGVWANGIQVEVLEYRDPGVISSAVSNRRTIRVYAPVEPGASVSLVETFSDVSLDPSSDRFIETVLARGIMGETVASQYVRADVYPIGPTVTVATGVLDTGVATLGRADLGNTPGQDGITGLKGSNGFSFYVGTVNGQVATGLQALRNPETTEFNLICVPGVSHKAVIAAAIGLCEARGDAMALIDPPLGLNVQEVVDWSNGLRASANGGVDPNAPAAPINSSYAAIYWPWLEINDPYTRKTLWLPPSGFVAAAMADSDDKNGPWIAVAGELRGKLSANRSEYSPTQAERDLLVGGANRVNPIINKLNVGLTIYGNRTTLRRNSALNNVHTRRMLLFAEKACATAVAVLHFNPNDRQTWKQFQQLCDTELNRVKAGRGIETFKVICDASTNPPAQRSNKTMMGKLLIAAMEAAEAIVLNFSVYSAGTTFDESTL